MELEESYKLKDHLTGFNSRALLSEYLHNLITEALSHPMVFSLLILDIDNFKLINDKFGHPAGDEALKFFANIIKETTEGKYFVARYGGDEFIIVMAGSQKEALDLARDIKRLLNKRFFICRERPLLIKSCIGIANFPFDADKAPDLIKKADEALYYAKRHGRNKVILASKLKSFYPKFIFKSVIKIAILAVLLFLIFKLQPQKFINLQAIYSQAIIKANYLFHKKIYKYNYCSLELNNGSRLEGWVIKEDRERIYISKLPPSYKTGIITIPKSIIRIYFKISK